MKKIPVDYKVDKDVPIPVRTGPDIGRLEVGESMEFPLNMRPWVASHASRLKRSQGKTYTIKKINASAARIWRIS